MRDADDCLLPHLREAVRLLTRAAVEADSSARRPRVIGACRRLIAYLAGKPASVGSHGQVDDPVCDLCFRRLYDPSRPDLCRRCRRVEEGRQAERSLHEGEAADQGRRAAMEAAESRITAGLKKVKGAPREADMAGVPHKDRPGKHSDSRQHERVRIGDAQKGRRLLARMLDAAGDRAVRPAELWLDSQGALSLEQVLALLRHDWFAAVTESGGCAYSLTSFARTEYLDGLVLARRRSKKPAEEQAP